MDFIKHKDGLMIPLEPYLKAGGKLPVNDTLTNQDLQAKELDAANIPADTKKLIAAEYWRLIKLHPKWKNSKAMRKAGEKYNVKFILE